MNRFQVIKIIIILIIATMLPLFAADESVTVNSNLTFGTMFPGIPKTVDKSSTAAAEFSIGGDAGAEVTIDFTLPAYLSSGANNMQIIFYSDGCAIDSNPTPNQSSPTYDDLNPWQTLTYDLGSSGLTIWIGGKAIPGVRQAAGTYTADIILTVQYTGL